MRHPRLTLNKKGQVVESRLKYGNEITERDGIKFRSKGEADRYSELRLLEKAGGISRLQLQVKFNLLSYGEIVGTYTCDFMYYEGEATIIEDYKGARTALFTLKWNLMKAMIKDPHIQRSLLPGRTIEFRLTKKTNNRKRGYPRKTSASRRAAG